MVRNQYGSAINGGKLKGYLDIRDGKTPDRMGIPYFIEQLNKFAEISNRV